jgi:hypothetical protein
VTARELYNAIQTGNQMDQQQALFGLLAQVQTLSIAVLELAGERKMTTGRDPLAHKSRITLGEFMELPGKGGTESANG